MMIHTAAECADVSKMALSGKRITSADGLSGNTVYDIVQDGDGFVWMGAAYGLCRYDGYSFVNYYSLSNDPARKIEATTGNLYPDQEQGLLWIHTSTFTFACYDLKTGRFADYTGRGDENRPFHRFMRSGNDMWMYDTHSGIRRVSRCDGKFVCTDYNVENKRLPSNYVTRMVEDGRHGIWALTSKGLVRIDSTGRAVTVAAGRSYIMGNEYRGNVVCLSEGNTVEMFSPDGRLLRKTVIPQDLGNVRVIRSNFVWQDRWMIFSGDTYCIDLKTWKATKPAEYQVSNGLLLDAADGYFFESNGTGKLWIFGPDGQMKELSLLPEAGGTAERRRKYTIRRGKDGLFYIASYGNGLFIYDPAGGAIRHFSASDPQAVIDSDYLTCLFIDRQGNLWVAQDAAGVALISVSQQSLADFILPAPEHRGDWANWVRMVAHGTDGNIILSTKDNKMHTLDPKAGRITQTVATKACAFAYMTDRDGHTWIATRGDGLYVDGRRYSKYDRGKHIPSSDFYDIKMGARGRVWLASYENGLIMTRYENGGRLKFSKFLDRNINESRLHQLELDPEGRLWIASSNGLYVVDTKLKDITDDDFKCFNTANGMFPFDEMRCLRFIKGHLWAGGKGSGAVKYKVGTDLRMTERTVITAKEGLADNTICSIIDDSYGNIWVATESGLSRIYDSDMKVKTYMTGSSPEQNCYSEGCALKLDDGRIAFGTRYGLTVIRPKRSYDGESKAPSPVCITDMRINGISVCDSNRLERTVNNMERISLKHNENTISLSFSNFEYTGIESALYQYYLEGSDKDWRPMTSVNHVEYGNLDPGTYTFHLRALSNDRWSGEKTLTVIVHQPWYNTWWAWLMYLVAAAALGLYIYNNARERLRLHQQMKLEKQLTEFRLGFFTNITHEFRTPLAIILGAIDKLGESGTPSKAALQTARRGTRRLLRLVNMLMEFRKVNTGNMRLRVERGDIITFLHDIYQDFWSMARQKEVKTTFLPFDRHYEVAFDRQMVETMVYNLLSNAVKYTPQRGCIAMNVKLDGTQIRIIVEDNGPGIGDDRLGSLFKPFMQGNVSQGGMGIGLYTAHRMATLHKGELTYRRATPEGGSVFTLSLPACDDVYTPDDYLKARAIDMQEKEAAAEATEAARDGSDEIIRELLPEALNDIAIAIIEDDADMMEQISGEIGRFFRINRHPTGRDGLERVKEDMPALVICDVMLPDIGGYEIVKQLKADAATAHIPVIMLTALDDDSHRLRCYEAGADDYMVKPCNFRLLVTRAVQLIRKSQRPQKPRNTETATRAPRIITSVADKNFMEKMNLIISQRISDPNLTIDQIAAALNMGRTKFFAKTKELTGVSPNKYLQNERMRIAADLLAEGELTVAEISYKVGILDASYFNKCFKARYGVVPSRYGRENE